MPNWDQLYQIQDWALGRPAMVRQGFQDLKRRLPRVAWSQAPSETEFRAGIEGLISKIVG